MQNLFKIDKRGEWLYSIGNSKPINIEWGQTLQFKYLNEDSTFIKEKQEYVLCRYINATPYRQISEKNSITKMPFIYLAIMIILLL